VINYSGTGNVIVHCHGNGFAGVATNVLQAGQIHGDVHLARAAAPVPDDTPWLRALWTLAAARASRVDLRYLSDPQTRCVDGFLVMRTHAAEQATAVDGVTRLRADLAEVPAHVRTRPVESTAELGHVLEPFVPHPAGVVERSASD
jgi:hypothetical protein